MLDRIAGVRIGVAAVLIGRTPSRAADVTFERLLNPEPQNWLMNHHDFSSQRFSTLDTINRVERQEPQARLLGRARRHLGQRIRRGDAAGRRRLHVHHRRLGRRLQDRRALGRPGPHRVEDGPGPGEAGPQPRRRAVGQSRHLGHRPRRPRDRDRQGDPARSSGTRSCSTSRAWRSRRRRSRSRIRSSSARPAATTAPATGSHRSMPRPASCNGRPSSSRRPASRAAKPGRTRSTPGRPAAARSMSPAPTIRRPT